MSVAIAIAIAETRAWVERAVIGLNLCPFATAAQRGGRVRYVLCEATRADALMDAFVAELDLLAVRSENEIETTLLVHPFVLGDFLDYNDFVGLAEDAIAARNLDGFAQLATFHPGYRFAGTDDDDPGNATNRSPYPTLQLLRETSIDRAVVAIPDPSTIYEANIATMTRLGPGGWRALRDACRDDAGASERAV